MKKALLIFSSLALVGLLFLGGLLSWSVHQFKSPGNLKEDKLVIISSGASVGAIANLLIKEGVLEVSPFIFKLGTRLYGKQTSLQAGEYLFPAQITPYNTMMLLNSGKTHQRHITIAEGLSRYQIAELLNNEPVLTGTIDIENLPPEGTLLPETYNFSYGDDKNIVLNRMQKDMKTSLSQLWEARDKNLPLKTKEEAVILASIVEKETGITSERARVAGVFINRLHKNMKLQSDPTTIYALTKGMKKMERPLTYKDLRTDSPYNTYQYTGLPPNPIANPGIESLKAVLHPETHSFLYFVANGDGGHVFSKTLREHNKNVSKWRKLNKQKK